LNRQQANGDVGKYDEEAEHHKSLSIPAALPPNFYRFSCVRGGGGGSEPVAGGKG